ncbi:hypothetical protein [Vibrio phage RYC]|nr:hypothetical protein [Vibrio phage RYC]
MKKLLTIALASVVASGCTSINTADNVVPISEVPDKLIENTHKVFFFAGLSFEGSAVQLDEEWVLSTKHHAFIKKMQGVEVFEHPTCDAVMWRRSSDSYIPVASDAIIEEQLTMLGYLPNFLPMASTKGKVLGNIVDGLGCTYTLLYGGIYKGMSGGGAYNSSEQLVGINVGWREIPVKWDHWDREFNGTVVILPVAYLQDWIEEVKNEN